MVIKVLGGCCQKSKDFFRNTKKAVKDIGIEAEVVEISDFVEIANYGVMQTPALVIDEKVVSYGKALKTEDIQKLIEEYIK